LTIDFALAVFAEFNLGLGFACCVAASNTVNCSDGERPVSQAANVSVCTRTRLQSLQNLYLGFFLFRKLAE